MNIRESIVGDEVLGSIQNCARNAAEILGIAPSASGSDIVDAVDSFLYRWQKGDRPDAKEGDDVSLLLGSLWAEQLVRDLGWEWASITFHGETESKAVAVCSPDRSLVVYPFHFVYGCMQNDAPVTVMLAYNMLKDGTKIPLLPPRGYQNLMDGVHHVVPRG